MYLLPSGKKPWKMMKSTNGPTNTLEIFSPGTNSFALVTPATLAVPTTRQAAAVLSDGRVLIAGGLNGSNPVAAVNIFDPSSDSRMPETQQYPPRESQQSLPF